MATLTPITKNTASFTNIGNSAAANLWASTVLPWQLALPWQYDTVVIDQIYANQTKN